MRIETKYSIGDVVFHGRNTVTARPVECPDCKGSKEWALTTPAGGSMVAPCPTCDTLYGSTGFITKYERTPLVERLTIGSVRFDSHDTSDGRDPVSYMCSETGVGSGSIWYESRLRNTHEEAWSDAVASIIEDEKRIAGAKVYHERERLKKAAHRAKRAAG